MVGLSSAPNYSLELARFRALESSDFGALSIIERLEVFELVRGLGAVVNAIVNVEGEDAVRGLREGHGLVEGALGDIGTVNLYEPIWHRKDLDRQVSGKQVRGTGFEMRLRQVDLKWSGFESRVWAWRRYPQIQLSI